MSVLSFLVNLVSLYLFHGIKKHDHGHKGKHNHSHDKPCSHSHQHHSKSYQNIKSKKNSSLMNKSFSGIFFYFKINKKESSPNQDAIQFTSSKSTHIARNNQFTETSITPIEARE